VVVCAALWQQTTSVAVKTLKPGAMSAVAFLDEAKTMHRLRHRKLVQLLGVCTRDEPMYIITELMPHGALLDYLRDDEGRTITIGVVIDMAAQVDIRTRRAVDVERIYERRPKPLCRPHLITSQYYFC